MQNILLKCIQYKQNDIYWCTADIVGLLDTAVVYGPLLFGNTNYV